MTLRTLLTRDADASDDESKPSRIRAVSPVIGVILMVAITVILAAVIATFVLGIGDSTEATPTAQFSFDYDSGNDQLTVIHDGGDTIDSARLTITGSDSGDFQNQFSSDVLSGSSVTVNSVTSGETVRVVWASEGGDSTQTLANFEVPGDSTVNSVSVDSAPDATANSATASETYAASINQNTDSVTVSLNLTENGISASDINDVSVITGSNGNNIDAGSLLDGTATVDTDANGQVEIGVKFASSITSTTETFEVEINQADSNVDSSDTDSADFTVDTDS